VPILMMSASGALVFWMNLTLPPEAIYHLSSASSVIAI